MYRVQALDLGPRVLGAVIEPGLKLFLKKTLLCVCHRSNRFMSMKNCWENNDKCCSTVIFCFIQERKKLVIIITNSKLNLRSKVARTVKTFFFWSRNFLSFQSHGIWDKFCSVFPPKSGIDLTTDWFVSLFLFASLYLSCKISVILSKSSTQVEDHWPCFRCFYFTSILLTLYGTLYIDLSSRTCLTKHIWYKRLFSVLVYFLETSFSLSFSVKSLRNSTESSPELILIQKVQSVLISFFFPW
jgi:hypothetical protein